MLCSDTGSRGPQGGRQQRRAGPEHAGLRGVALDQAAIGRCAQQHHARRAVVGRRAEVRQPRALHRTGLEVSLCKLLGPLGRRGPFLEPIREVGAADPPRGSQALTHVGSAVRSGTCSAQSLRVEQLVLTVNLVMSIPPVDHRKRTAYPCGYAPGGQTAGLRRSLTKLTGLVVTASERLPSGPSPRTAQCRTAGVPACGQRPHPAVMGSAIASALAAVMGHAGRMVSRWPWPNRF